VSRALAGRRIAVTRPRDDPRLRMLLEAEGAEVVECPTIRIEEPSDYGPLDAALRGLAGYAWVVFTSRNGVAAVFRRLGVLGLPLTDLSGRRLAVIGPGTAEALRERGLRADVSPAEFRAEALVAALARHPLRGSRVLVPRAAVARDVLPEGLRALGAAVDVVPAYQTGAVDEGGRIERLLTAARAGGLDAVTFTSPSTVRQFVRLAGPNVSRVLDGALVACIGPVTAGAARASGLDVGAVAATYTLAGLVAALCDALGPRAGRAAPDPRDLPAAHVRNRDGVRDGIS
jgi:uroporphyrinogen III methyltransferase / synthase